MPSDQPTPETPLAAWEAVSVRYPYQKQDAVGPIDLAIRRGERVLLLGPSGSGKSTLLLTLTGLIPHSIPADVGGKVLLRGEPVAEREPAGWAGTVAHFFQDADQTLCGMRVEEEIAFALENRGFGEAEILERVKVAMRLVGLPEEWRERRTMTLSGGEKQLVALAATLVQDADLFVADEPTAHLAPEAARRLHELLVESGNERTVLIVDHRLDGLIGSVDRVVVLGSKGTVIANGPPRGVFRQKREELTARGIWCPLSSLLDAELKRAGVAAPDLPLSLEEAFDHLDPQSAPGEMIGKARPAVADFVAARSAVAAPTADDTKVVARIINADCAPFLGPVVLRNVNVELRAGEVLGILGINGAGKSTLAACLAGVLRPKRGRREGQAGGIAFQKPETQFTEASVRDEIASAFPRSFAAERRDKLVHELLSAWDLEPLAGRHPFELSQGQKRRVALAGLMAGDRWPLIVLDEPLAGLDAKGAARVEEDIDRLRQAGRALAVVTHDMDFALRVCPRSIVVGEGGIMAEGATETLLSDRELLRRAGLAEPAIAPALRWLAEVGKC